MRLYAAFLKDLDSDGKSTSALLSEIDLSNPEDAKALIPDHNSEILVHFGKENFLARYKRFEGHIAEWRSQYPRLSNVDMRYERQVVLQMPPKDATISSQPIETPSNDTTTTVRSQVASVSRLPPQPDTKKVTANAPHPVSPVATHPVQAKAANSGNPGEMDAATRKRVDAIEARMAQRQKAHATAQAKSSAASGAVKLN